MTMGEEMKCGGAGRNDPRHREALSLRKAAPDIGDDAVDGQDLPILLTN